MSKEFKPDFSRIGETIYTRGDRGAVEMIPEETIRLHGGEFFPRSVTCSESDRGDPSGSPALRTDPRSSLAGWG